MSVFFQLVISGLAVGFIYSGIAIGYFSIYSATAIINFALGAQAMGAGYITYVWLKSEPMALRIVIALVIGAAFSTLSWRLIYKRIFDRHGPLPTVIASFALSLAIQELIRIAWTPNVHPADSPFGSRIFRFSGISLSAHQVGMLVVGALVFLAMCLLFRTRWALLAKAIFQDPMMARALGVPASVVIDAIFAISGAVAAVVGVLLSPLTSLTPTVGFTVALTGFVGAVIGGIGGVFTAGTGALIIGVAESLFAGYGWPAYTNALIFGALVVVLIVRPSGLLGRQTVARV